MTSIGSPSPFFFGGKKAYEVQRSLRFNGADGPYLEHTPSSHSNKRKMTFSFWFKRAVNTNFVSIFRAYGNSSNRHSLDFVSGGQIRLWGNYNGSVAMTVQTTQVFRDFSAWYHFVLVLDTEQGTASNRVKMYVNGVQITDFATASYPSQNFDFAFNDQNAETQIGVPSDTQCNFYIAEFQEIDGLALDPSYFGETDALTGQWNPKKYTGSYGTNGFYLNFSDNSGTTATTLGKDSSGNGNNFTPNNLSVYDSMPDTPTNNFAVMNPLTNYSGLSQGNLRFNNYNDSGGNRSTQATFALPKSGKWYLEARYQEDYIHSIYMGLSQIQMNTGYVTTPTVYYNSLYGTIEATGESNVSGGSWYNIGSGNSVILSMAIDVDNNSVKFYKDNSLQGTITLPTLTSLQEYFFTWANSSGGSSSSLNNTFNFGADSTFQGQETSGGNADANGIGDFKYAPPSGHLALCSANLPDPTIKLPNKHFAAFSYTGTGADYDIVNITNSDVDFTPDWVWIKSRVTTNNHILTDSVRGGTKYLMSNSSSAEITDTDAVRAFIQNGFESGTDGNTHYPGRTYVAWNWNAGDTDGKTYTVTVVDDSGNKYRFDGYGTSAVTLDLAEGGTYIFNYPSAHPFRFSETSDGEHGGGSEYTTGVTVLSSTSVQIIVAASAPTLYYYCTQHSGMGGQINTNSTLGSSNFDGSIQSIAKANTTAGFSIVTYTGNNTAGATVGHGLGVAPQIVITKRLNSGDDWRINIGLILGSGKEGHSVKWNSTGGEADTNSLFNSTNPTSSVFTIGNDADVNSNGSTYLAYCFSSVASYSKFDKYIGNGNEDGTFVFTGFRPAWLLMKNVSSGSTNFILKTAKLQTHNVMLAALQSNRNDAEQSSLSSVDFLSNGFKIRNNGSFTNTNGDTYIYWCFAESPFKNARAR